MYSALFGLIAGFGVGIAVSFVVLLMIWPELRCPECGRDFEWKAGKEPTASS